MPDNKQDIELKIIDDNLKYDLDNHIFINTNLGKVKIDCKDALEIMYALLDATNHLNKETENLYYEIEDEIAS